MFVSAGLSGVARAQGRSATRAAQQSVERLVLGVELSLARTQSAFCVAGFVVVLSPSAFTEAAKHVRQDKHRVGRDARLGAAGRAAMFDRLS